MHVSGQDGSKDTQSMIAETTTTTKAAENRATTTTVTENGTAAAALENGTTVTENGKAAPTENGATTTTVTKNGTAAAALENGTTVTENGEAAPTENGATTEIEENGPPITETDNNGPTTSEILNPEKQQGVPSHGGGSVAPLQSQMRLLGVSSTTTITDFSIVTSTVFYSCLSGSSAAVCTGRRRRRQSFRESVDLRIRDQDDGSSDLDTSLMEQQSAIDTDVMKATQQQHDNNDDDAAKNSKLFVTIWTVSRTTSTVTMLFTDTSTTLRLSFFCQAGFQRLPSGCPGA
ncbi:hypothetical protein Pcinc_043783 [Petrolisthes cinctipes]|uniref:Uncharacterized protein n=1 Tax=Petrolisthes cinctipes TaxID=88211 RepID=A0AAE1EFY8_PETCI|nr:hypothetical protein Pcinc_043783 [Petrolisthes cinctipes]